MKKLIFATGNENKMKEIRMILADCGYEILSMKEAGIQADIVEDGKTFEENAIIKAEAIRKTIEEDSDEVSDQEEQLVAYHKERDDMTASHKELCSPSLP